MKLEKITCIDQKGLKSWKHKNTDVAPGICLVLFLCNLPFGYLRLPGWYKKKQLLIVQHAQRKDEMDNFEIIYKILHFLEMTMDNDAIDFEFILPKSLGITKNRWEKIIVMLVEEGFIVGIGIAITGGRYYLFNYENMRISLKGLEYLEENKQMKRAAEKLIGIERTLT